MENSPSQSPLRHVPSYFERPDSVETCFALQVPLSCSDSNSPMRSSPGFTNTVALTSSELKDNRKLRPWRSHLALTVCALPEMKRFMGTNLSCSRSSLRHVPSRFEGPDSVELCITWFSAPLVNLIVRPMAQWSEPNLFNAFAFKLFKRAWPRALKRSTQ